MKAIRLAVAAAALLFVPALARAAIVGKPVTYQIDGKPYEGYFARNTTIAGKLPVVLVIQDWDGLNGYEKRRAEMLAEMGYAAFAIDLYGRDDRPADSKGYAAASGALLKDRAELRKRLQAGLVAARAQAGVDPQRVAAIGYCFGGGATLELARTGADLAGFVVFHGVLATPPGEDYAKVAGPLLIEHGSEDEASPMPEVAKFAAALDAANVQWQMDLYSGVHHAFTVWSGRNYDAEADRKSWLAMLAFLNDKLPLPGGA